MKTILDLEREAAAIAFRSLGSETKEQAFARLIEANPDVYAAYRTQHNAQALVAALQAAGVQLRKAG